MFKKTNEYQSLKLNLEELETEIGIEQKNNFLRKILFKKNLPIFKKITPWVLLFLVCLATIVRALGNSQTQIPTSGSSFIEVLVTMVPLQKGSQISPEILKLIPLKKSDLTPRQRLDCLNSEQLHELKFPLRAKKNIPPHGILFWKDLEIEFPKSPKSRSSLKTQIIFSDSHNQKDL